MRKKEIFRTIAFSVIVLCVIILLDYYNIFGMYLGIKIENFNFDILTLIVGNIVVVTLFVITYFLVDSRNIKRHRNQEMVAYLTLKNVYKQCREMTYMFSNPKVCECAAKNCDGNELIFNDKVHMHYLTKPFANESIIVNLAVSGVITKEIYDEYLLIKELYQEYINKVLVLYEMVETFSDLRKMLIDKLTQESLKLDALLKNNKEE